MDKSIGVYPYNRMVYSNENEPDYMQYQESHKYNAQWEKLDTKKYTLHALFV